MMTNPTILKNVKAFPEVFYGLHMEPGVAEYREPDAEPYRILINEDTVKQMDKTFPGKPVYVRHVNEVNLANLQQEADGYVSDSFYNKSDGKHWVKFIAISDKAKQAIKAGWKLSNAYVPKTFSNGGMWHGLDYQKEVTSGEYEHLALVENPRYEDSVIMTPEAFKKYNNDKELELKKLANSKDEKGDKKMGLNFFKRAKVENSIDLEGLMVTLPTSKKDILVNELVAAYDKIENMHGYASPDHMVKVGENEMSVKDLVKKHMDACNEIEDMKKSAVSEEGGEPGKGADDDAPKKNDEDEAGTESAGKKDVGDRGGDKHLNEDEDEKEVAAKKKNEAAKKAQALKNAGPLTVDMPSAKITLPSDRIALGHKRYGSK